MSTPGEDSDRTELLEAINEYVNLLSAMDNDALRKDELADWIIKRMAAHERIEVAEGVGVQLTGGVRRFSPERAATIFTPEQLAEVSVTTVSTTLAKRLYPVEFEAAKVTGAPTLRRL
jgi:hypothetical protein